MKKEILSETENNLAELIHVLSDFDQEKINAKPFEGSWSAAQVGEHLLKSYGVVEVLDGPTREAGRPADLKNAEINSIFLNYDIKMESPDFIIPSEGEIDKRELIEGIRSRKDQFLAAIDTKDLTELCLAFALPEIGELTRLEWINFVNAHTKRHTRQIKKIAEAVLKDAKTAM